MSARFPEGPATVDDIGDVKDRARASRDTYEQCWPSARGHIFLEDANKLDALFDRLARRKGSREE